MYIVQCILYIVHNYTPSPGGQQKTWSTYPVYNTLTQDFQTVPAISITETDHERDGIIDQYNITLQFKDDKIASIQGMFVFSYVLSDLCSLVMRVPLIIQKVYTLFITGMHTVMRLSYECTNYP